MTKSTTCSKCNGTGNLKNYSHVMNGVCFKCNGTGDLSKSNEQAKQLEARRVVAREQAQYAAIRKSLTRHFNQMPEVVAAAKSMRRFENGSYQGYLIKAYYQMQ